MEAQKIAQQGFSLIEILIALLIFLIGLLGLATLIVNGIKFSDAAGLRSQAVVLAYDMADKIRANGGASNAYQIALGSGTANVTDCAAQTCTREQIATADVNQWKNDLANRLPAGDGANVLNGNLMTITVQWNDRGEFENYRLVVRI